MHCVAGQAQDLRIQAITVADGLSQGFVSCLFQDSRGFVWIGTYGGLNRYDGYQVKRYNSDHLLDWSLTANSIHAITEDKQGLIWLSTEQGPVVHDPFSERFVRLNEFVPDLPKSEAEHIFVAKDGLVWICHRQPNSSGVVVVKPPPDLASRIRKGHLTGADWVVRHVRLAPGVSGPIPWFSLLQDSIWGAADANLRFCRINPATLIAEHTDPLTLNYERYGNYGLFYSGKDKGFVFLPSLAPWNIPNNITRWSDFVQLPDGRILLCRSGLTEILVLDALPAHQETPGFELLEFYKQFSTYCTLDKPLTYACMVDHAGNLWLGTGGHGTRIISGKKLDYTRFMPQKSISNLCFLPDGRIWPGIFSPHEVLNPQTGALEPVPWREAFRHISPYWTYGLLVSRSGEWWMVAHTEAGLGLFKKKSGETRYTLVPIPLKWHKDVPIRLLEDRNGAVWLAGNEGQVFRIRPVDMSVSQWNLSGYFPKELTPSMRSNSLVEDRKGNLWIGSNIGLVRIESPAAEPAFRVWHNRTNAAPLFSSAWISCVYPDPEEEHVVWLGLKGGGLMRFHAQTQKSEYFTENDGLANNVVYGILPDSFGYLWLSTNRGLSRFHLRNKSFASFQEATPEVNIEFNTGGYGLAPSGALAFGSTEGLFFVHPHRESIHTLPPHVEIIYLEVNGQPTGFSSENQYLSLKPDNSFALRLPYDQNNLVVRFAAPKADEPASVQYRYRLSPLGKHWVNTGFQRTANFVGIPPGRYTVEIQAKNSDGDWDNAPTTTLHLIISPPWYRSLWAWAGYALLAIIVLRVYFRMVRKRITLEQEMALNQKEMAQLKTLDTFKNRFFAYVSHEFKTPLTIIIGLAERLRRQQKDTAVADNIAQQGQALLELVDQMVDIARLEEQSLRLNVLQGNFCRYIRYLTESIRPLADFGKVRLDMFTPDRDIVMDFDPLRLRYIVSNLLSNAVRHTPPGGSVQVRVLEDGPDSVRLEIADTGSGISPEDLPHIFERYYRGKHEADAHASQHFGLGLAFVKDLVELFGGTISVNSTPGRGTTFGIALPITRNAKPMTTQPLAPHSAPNIVPSNGDTRSSQAQPLLLVVEDNPDIAAYLHSFLRPHFHLIIATNGSQGWEQALKQIPDLILSDVMMPGMDGLELTHALKSHTLTNHIPVVLLSARSELEARLSGQQQGADAYLGKPFDEQELLLTLKNLHTLQRRWKERYAGAHGPKIRPTSENDPPHPTDVFMENLFALFEKNYTNDEYGLPQLCREMEVSKSQLQRKLSAMSDQSAMDLLRRYRLQKAYDLLLKNRELSIKEAGFLVGFKDPAHFSRTFAKVMGFPPSEARTAKPEQ